MSKNCFIISPIGEPGTEVRRNADLLFTYVIEPPLKKARLQSLARRHDSDARND